MSKSDGLIPGLPSTIMVGPSLRERRAFSIMLKLLESGWCSSDVATKAWGILEEFQQQGEDFERTRDQAPR